MKYFDSVIGYEDIKLELARVLDTIRYPNKYRDLGVKTLSGVLLYGEPGVGKTMFSTAFLKAAERPSFVCRKDKPNGEFVNEIKNVFEKAMEAAPSIVLLDDMDKFANEDYSRSDAEEYITIQSCIQYFNCSNYRANRGTCPSTHYIRADSIEQVVIAELQTIAKFLDEEEDEFVEMLESKTNKDIATEQKLTESQLATARARVKEIERLYERIYEDNVNGKVSDEWFMKLSHKYEVEMEETKKNILALREKLDSLAEKRQTKENFVKAVRSFMEMKTLNPVILRELIEKIEVHQIEGTGKNRTQRVVIHYRFVGCLQIPEWHRKRKVTLESRQGVAVNYLPTTA